MKKLMIYGATGYTGRMIVTQAMRSGVPLILAGRNDAKLAVLASELNLPYRSFSLRESASIDEALADVAVLLNCAGPFMRTADTLMKVTIRKKIHYLDITAELDSYRLAENLDRDARAAGVMLLPGCGGSVAMLGCLAVHAKERSTAPESISLALHIAGAMSRGSAISATENLSPECLIRRDGLLIRQDPTEVRTFDFGQGPLACFPVTLPDLITVWKATNIPDIATFVHVTGAGFPQGKLSALPDGPTAEERDVNRYQAVAEVVSADGKTVRMLLDTVNGYSFTAIAAAEAGRRVLAGQARPGFQTPAMLFGKDFAETIADTRMTEY
ncbi:saccharopine dehydrogenase NADP-binding domain-containing protein [Brenneria goodwinii]|uniref:INTEGRAL MEMBRANE PROTEIN (Rhomboid family) n=1 Tax=Brenneria goodwinii TaxID=1109412 RepID=A0A0G4JQQ7_9GAMM|nr:saccharopine dehydrogenase NADP-binding domain-containing protein [Brenneria goodwinii]MCG8158291.1 saccharopine dehydrogenase NADP-binding domain-containing protein [Brenneria goodwinii]MCG8162379.1 saccharopine dehydrogenase NADP-binding domain-containing protein [Brenneria goodwinii]MCG8167341.1 saccharopine dehydrogenase NADP-binding domain-containing protein [Brenneria goodwinii]MCG8171991.1 saccharopine dehydrogenase NADP-binding domain-containing protein [Brenneria goodwinii]MCG81756